MGAFDFTPYYRSTVGFARLPDMLDQSVRSEWPPYNTEKKGKDQYRITMTVAGFAADEIELVQLGATLLIIGQKSEQPELLHQGIPLSFKQSFSLADHVRVAGANVEHGLLMIDLVREVPEQLKPQRIDIGARAETKAAKPESQPKQIDMGGQKANLNHNCGPPPGPDREALIARMEMTRSFSYSKAAPSPTPSSVATIYNHPMDVTNNSTLTIAEKKAILASWISDARAVAPSLRRLDRGAVVPVDEIRQALVSLDEPMLGGRDTDRHQLLHFKRRRDAVAKWLRRIGSANRSRDTVMTIHHPPRRAWEKFFDLPSSPPMHL